MVLFEMTPITYSGEHLPLFATVSNPMGSHTTWTIEFCSWTCSWARGNGAHKGVPVLTLCLDTLNDVISDKKGAMAQSITVLLKQNR